MNCDNKGKTLTLIQVKENGKLFGAFTDIPWKSSGGWVGKDGNSFLFSLKDNEHIEILKNVNKSEEVCHFENRLTYFSSAFCIHDNCNNV